MKKVVVKVCVNAGDRHQSPCRSILIGLAKIMVPWGFLWEKITPTAAQNKTKALKVAVSLPGVCEAGLEGEEKNQLVVKGGDEFDPVILIRKLRKKVASAEIVSVGPEKKDDKKEDKKEDPQVVYHYPHYGAPNLQFVEIPEPTPFCRFW